MSEYDVAVIGGGAAGLSAALVLARAQRKVLVVDAGNPRNAPASEMHGFLSRDGMKPTDLLGVGRAEVEGYGGVIVHGFVGHIARRDESGFTVDLDDGQTMTARRVLIATGLRDELPDVPGLRERWARDVLHCPYCHGHEVRGQRIGVLGGTSEAVKYAQIVRQWSDQLVYFTPPNALSETEREELVARAIVIVEGDIAHLVIENDRLEAVELDDGRIVARDAVFVPPRFLPNNDLLVANGFDLDANGWVVTDATGQTSAHGVWVAGNIANPRAQVITAAGEGSAAALAINADLVDEDVQNAVRDHLETSKNKEK